MSAPSLYYVTQTPQREFATAKVVIILHLCKFAKHILQKNAHNNTKHRCKISSV